VAPPNADEPAGSSNGTAVAARGGKIMNPSEIRSELLDQHGQIRALMDEIRRLAPDAAVAGVSGGELERQLQGLAFAVARHNVREEELLRGILATVDAWGPARVEIMDESHEREHQALHDALLNLPKMPGPLAPSSLDALFHRVLEHMKREERTLLSEDVLKDDAVLVEFGG
jgi:hypothetical protein